MLAEMGLVRSDAKAGQLFDQLIGDFLRFKASTPHDYVYRCWQKYEETNPTNHAMNGNFFELCIATVLVREDVLPFYMQAKVTFIPNIEYDFILYTTDRGPVCLSAKTTLRERYKQADLEAVALKNVHRRARSYLVNISPDENRLLQEKIAAYEVMGLDGSINALDPEFDDFIAAAKKWPLELAGDVRAVTSEVVIADENVRRVRR